MNVYVCSYVCLLIKHAGKRRLKTMKHITKHFVESMVNIYKYRHTVHIVKHLYKRKRNNKYIG